jgi:hypothetical protein
MIKVMNMVGLIMAPIVVEFSGFSPLTVGIIIVGFAIIIWGYSRSDRDFELIEDEEGLEAISRD